MYTNITEGNISRPLYLGKRLADYISEKNVIRLLAA